MRPAYIRAELDDSGDVKAASFIVSPVPFVCHYGDILIPAKSEQRKAASYTELCSILAKDFHIPKTLLPPEKYLKPTRAERDGDCRNIYRIAPEGTGEPEWRTKARRAIIGLLEEDETLLEKGQVSINNRICYSLEELREELGAVAEQTGGRKQTRGEAYQPDYDILVNEILKGYTPLLECVELPKSRKKSR